MPQSPEGPGAPTDIGPDGMMMGADPMTGQEGMPGMDPGMDPGMEEGLPPGLPGDEEMPPGGEEDGGSPFPPDDDPGGAPPPGKKDKKKDDKKDKGKSKKESGLRAGARLYRTAFGDTMPEESYLRHLALLHSGGSARVMAALRREAVNSGAPYCQCSPGAAPGRHCPACGRRARPGIHQGTLPDDEEQQYREEQRDAS